MKKLLLIAVLVGAGYVGFIQDSLDRGTANESDQILASAFESRRSGFQVEGRGVVVRVLADDVDGDRHQRFIIQLNSGQTLLMSHNIDLAPRVAGLREGEAVVFNGEYEWNSEGGVLHWTHRDPAGRHPAGWLKHDGRTYQ
ncbi:MAG: DUF3465 domain-containing protein [Candidatus Binatia bacterium]